MPRFEYIEGASSKFWEIQIEGTRVTTSWGRIGTAGQSKTKDFATPEKAQAEHDGLVREKVGKGYKEVGPGSAGVPPALHEAEAGAAPGRRDAGAPRNDDGPGEIWTDALRRKLHPRRSSGVQLRPRRPAEALARLREYWSTHCRSLWVQSNAEQQDEVTARIFRLACERLDSDAAGPPPDDPETEAAFFALLSARSSWAHSIEDVIVDFWFASRGPAFTVEALAGSLRVHPVAEGSEAVKAVILYGDMQLQENFGRLRLERTWSNRGLSFKTFAGGVFGPWARLRRLLAGVGEAEWEQARDVAARLREQADHLIERIALSFLFPDVPAWAEEDARLLLDGGGSEIAAAYLLASVRDGGLLERLMGTVSFLYLPKLDDQKEEGDVAGLALAMAEGAGPAAVPALIAFLKKCWVGPARRDCAEALAVVPDERALATLVAKGYLKEAADAAQRFPRQGIPGLAAEVTGGSKEGRACGPVLARLVRQYPDLARELLPGLSEAARRVIEPELGRAETAADEAPPEALPAVLVQPPWTAKRAKPRPEPELRLEPLPLPEETAWSEGQREEWLATEIEGEQFGRTDKGALNLLYLSALTLGGPDEELRGRIRKLLWCATGLRASALALMSEGLALALWEELPAAAWSLPRGDGIERFVAKYELRILPGLIALAEARPAQGLPFLLPIRSPRVARIAATALGSKVGRPAAQRWLRVQGASAALALVPPALGAAGKDRDDARAALRFLATEGEEAAVLEAASRYGGEARAAMEEVLAVDPLQLFPAKLPKMPAFWQPSVFARPLLRDRRALPLPAVEHLGTMLAFSRMDDPYAGLVQVREACDPGSLGAFAWDLFQAWLDAGAPARDGWAFQSLALLGGDEQVRRLVPKIREWPAQTAFPRAVTGLDVLATLGSDVALMHLHGIAQKAKHKSLQARAQEKLDELAERRGLTSEELADRLVPDLGLGADGSRVLDFGPRSFRTGFDEHLRPYVRDAEGKRLPDLPKPGKGDDADKAAQAQEAWKALKKDAKALAAQQILRLELAMAGCRRWEPEVFRLLLAGHPLVQHLARRLVWSAYDGTGGLLGTFRVAEDGSLADAADEPWDLPAGVSVGVAHPLEMETALLTRWSEVFADYEILQPFPQLGREVYRIAEDERETKKLQRFEGEDVSTGKVLKLVDQRGWRRGPTGDGGFIWYVEKPLPDRRNLARLELQPGISVGSPMEHPEQTLGAVIVNRPGSWVDQGVLAFGKLDPVAFSELVRDVEMLRG